MTSKYLVAAYEIILNRMIVEADSEEDALTIAFEVADQAEWERDYDSAWYDDIAGMLGDPDKVFARSATRLESEDDDDED